VWAIDALAAVLAEDPGVRRWIPPRRHPARAPADLDAVEEQVYRRCDGRPAFEAGPIELVAKLAKRGLLVWAFRVPVGPHPERELRAQLGAIGDPAVQAAAARTVTARCRLIRSSGTAKQDRQQARLAAPRTRSECASGRDLALT
jgi:hypothetical protein